MTTRKITGVLYGSDGSLQTGKRITAVLVDGNGSPVDGWDVEESPRHRLVPNRVVTLTDHTTGAFELDLVPNDRIYPATQYRITVRSSDVKDIVAPLLSGNMDPVDWYDFYTQGQVLIPVDLSLFQTYLLQMYDAIATTLQTFGTLVVNAVNKTTPDDADLIGITDSTAGHVARKLTWGNLKSALHTWIGSLFGICSVDFYGGLAAACSSSATVGKELIVSSNQVLTAAFTTDRSIVMNPGGLITSEFSRTFTGPFSAEGQAFSGTGLVVFGSSSVHEIESEWFGSTWAACNKALAAAGGIPVTVNRDYTAESTVSIGNNQTLRLGSSIITAALSNPGPIIQNTDQTGGNTGITISGGKFDGLGATQSVLKPIIYFKGVNNSKVSNVIINNAGANLSATGDSTLAAIQLHDCVDVDVIGNTLTNVYKLNGIVATGTTSSNVRFDGNRIENAGDSGLSVADVSHASVTNNYVKNSIASNITFNGSYGLVQGNTVIDEDAGVAGTVNINIGHTGGGVHPADYVASYTKVIGNTSIGGYAHGISVSTGSSIGVVVSDNSVSNAALVGLGAGISTAGTDGIVTGNYLNGNYKGISLTYQSSGTTQHQTVTGNVVVGSRLEGIHVNSNGNIVSGNTIKNNGLTSGNKGIYLTATRINNIISSNFIYDDQTVPTQTIGIYETASGNIITGNMFSGATTSAHYTTGDTYTDGLSVSRGNVFSSAAAMSQTVAITASTATTVVNNVNIRSTGGKSSIVIIPMDAAGWAKTPFVQSIVDGVLTIGHVSSAGAPYVRVIIL